MIYDFLKTSSDFAKEAILHKDKDLCEILNEMQVTENYEVLIGIGIAVREINTSVQDLILQESV